MVRALESGLVLMEMRDGKYEAVGEEEVVD